MDDNENAAPPAPSAPPPDMFGTFAGYENVNCGEWKEIEVWLSGSQACYTLEHKTWLFFHQTVKQGHCFFDWVFFLADLGV